jgi:Coenzyme PQQ synthesis protein D (PqqD)
MPASILRLRRDQLEWREIEGEIIALDLRTSRYLAVNRSGARIWSTLAEGASRDELAHVLIRSYGVPPEQAETETGAFLQMLADEDLLDVDDA